MHPVPPFSPVAVVLNLAERALTVRHLLGRAPLHSVPGDEECATAYARLCGLGLDNAILEEGPPHHFVRRSALPGRSGPAREVAEPIDTSMIVAADLPLAALIEMLALRDFVFVLDGAEVSGIVTLADLQNPIIGLYVFGLLVATERACDQLIARYTNRDWKRLVSPARLKKIQEVYNDRVATNTEIDLLACSNLDDRLTMVAGIAQLRSALGWRSKSQADKAAKEIKRVRNSLAHGDTLLSAVPDPRAAVAAIGTVRRLAETAWRLVDDDQNLWKIHLATTLHVEVGGADIELNGPDAAAWPWPGKDAWIITAANPMSLLQTDRQNEEANKLLAHDLRRVGYAPVRATGLKGSWREDSWLVTDAEEVELLRLGCRYRQRTVFHVTDTTVTVVDCSQARRVARRARRSA